MFAGTVGPSLEGMEVFNGDFGAGKRILLLGFSDSRNIRYESPKSSLKDQIVRLSMAVSFENKSKGDELKVVHICFLSNGGSSLSLDPIQNIKSTTVTTTMIFRS